MDSTRKLALGTENETKVFNTINRFIKELGFWVEWKRYLAFNGVTDWWKYSPTWVFNTGNFHWWAKLPNGVYFSDLFRIFLYFFDRDLLKKSIDRDLTHMRLIRDIRHCIDNRKGLTPLDSLRRAFIYLNERGYINIWMIKKIESESQKQVKSLLT
jgi:hypothetical protein